MNSKGLVKRAQWFIHQEVERTLSNFETGVISKDHAIGSLNTVFQIASQIEDQLQMKMICTILTDVRQIKVPFGLVKKYRNNNYDQIEHV